VAERLELHGNDSTARLGVVDAAAPEAPADRLEARPEGRVRRQRRIGPHVVARGSGREHSGCFLRRPLLVAVAGEVDGGLEARRIDDDPHTVSVDEPPERSALERLRTDVADAGAGGDAGEAGVRDERDLAAEGEEPKRRGELVGLLHSRSHGAASDQHDHVARLDRLARDSLDRGDRVRLAREDASTTVQAVDTVLVERASVDRGRLDYAPAGGEIAAGEADGRRHALGPGPVGR
jgi:hypothetical protein